MSREQAILHPDTAHFAKCAARRTMRKMPLAWVRRNKDDLFQHARIAGWRAQEDFRPGKRSLHSFVTLYVEQEFWRVFKAAHCQKRGRGAVVFSLDEPLTEDGDLWEETLEGDSGDYLTPLVLQEEIRHVVGLLDALPVKQREALALHYLHGLTGAQAAALLGCKASTLNLRRFNGMTKLRTLLLLASAARREGER